MFTTLVASDRRLRRRAMTPGTLILSCLIHGTLLAGAVYATVPPIEDPGRPIEFVVYREGRQTSETPRADNPSGPLPEAPAFAPPRLLTSPVIDVEVTAEFVVLPNGRVDLSTVAIVNASHAGLGPAARTLIGQLRFTPARFHGEPVAALTRLPIVLRLGGG